AYQVFQDISVFVVSSYHNDVTKIQLGLGVGVHVWLTVCPASVAPAAGVVLPEGIGSQILHFDAICRRAPGRGIGMEGHAEGIFWGRVLAALIKDKAQVVGIGEERVLNSPVGCLHAI